MVSEVNKKNRKEPGNMRRNIFVLSIILLTGIIVSQNVFGSIAIKWQWDLSAGAGVYRYGGTELLPAGRIVQLIWSPVASAPPVDPLDPLRPTGGCIALATNATNGDGWWDFGVATYDEENYGISDTNYFATGYVFQRVFDVAWGNTPKAGDWYGDGVFFVQAPSQHQAPPPPPTVSALWDSGGSNPYILNQQIVPEPNSLTLLGLGLVVIGTRQLFRSRRKK
jgi:hypothetical protein